MKILIYVLSIDGKRHRISLDDWQSNTDPLTVYNNRGIPVYLTKPNLRWSGVTELYRRDIVGTWQDCWSLTR